MTVMTDDQGNYAVRFKVLYRQHRPGDVAYLPPGMAATLVDYHRAEWVEVEPKRKPGRPRKAIQGPPENKSMSTAPQDK